jgi:hypothetical protein
MKKAIENRVSPDWTEERREAARKRAFLTNSKRTNEENMKYGEAKSKWYELTFPNKKTIIIKNLSKYCRENNLSAGNLCSVSKGKLKHYKGYKCRQLSLVEMQEYH